MRDIPGQMSLFDLFAENTETGLADEEFPDVGEYEKDELLAFEKESLGIYISGHPMESWEGTWQNQITNPIGDFIPDEESGAARVRDNSTAIVGGMVTGKTIKITKNNQRMAFITLEDLTGSLEVVVFPRDFEKNE